MILRLMIVVGAVLALPGCNEKQPKDPKQVEFDRKFDQEAVLVKTCPGDPGYATGPTASTQRVYRYEKELWYQTVTGGYRKVEATPDTVCDILILPK